MKVVVVREVEFFMFRPGLSERARYYGIVFLNQLALSHRESEGGCWGLGVVCWLGVGGCGRWVLVECVGGLHLGYACKETDV